MPLQDGKSRGSSHAAIAESPCTKKTERTRGTHGQHQMGDRLKRYVEDLAGLSQVFPMSTLKGERKLAVAGGVCLTPLLLHMSQVAVGGVGQRLA